MQNGNCAPMTVKYCCTRVDVDVTSPIVYDFLMYGGNDSNLHIFGCLPENTSAIREEVCPRFVQMM